jgi:hypothetical protein
MSHTPAAGTLSLVTICTAVPVKQGLKKKSNVMRMTNQQHLMRLQKERTQPSQYLYFSTSKASKLRTFSLTQCTQPKVLSSLSAREKKTLLIFPFYVFCHFFCHVFFKSSPSTPLRLY